MTELVDLLPARTLGLRARRARLEKLARLMTRAEHNNPYINTEWGGVTTAPTGDQVQITFPSTAPVDANVNTYLGAVGGAPNVDTFCNFFATPKIYGGNADHVQFQNGTTSAATAAAAANISQTVSGSTSLTTGRATTNALMFRTDAPQFTLKLFPGGGNPNFRLIRDGRYVVKTPGALTTAPANRFVQVNVAARKMSDWTLEIEQDTAFDALYTDKLSTVEKYPTNHFARACILMDSYGITQTGGSPMWDGPIMQLMKKVGIIDVRNMSIAGTGFVNAGAAWPFGSHVNDMAGLDPDVVFVGTPFNDNGQSAAAIRAAVKSTCAAIRALHPYAVVVVIGSWTAPIATLAACQAAEDAAVLGYQDWADGHSMFIRLARRTAAGGTIAARQIYFGSGNDANIIGDGNADLYIKGDGTHPNRLGFDYTADFLLPEYRAGIAALLANA